MKKVYAAHQEAQAQLLCGHLRANGIAAVVQGEFLSAGRGELPVGPSTGPGVWIEDDADFERARQLVFEWEHAGQPTPTRCPQCGYDLHGLSEPRCPECGQPFHEGKPAKPWTCPACRELVEGQFSECWKCGGPAPEVETA